MQRPLVMLVDGATPPRLPEYALAIDGDVVLAQSPEEGLELAKGRRLDAAVLRPGGTAQAVADAAEALRTLTQGKVPFAVIGTSVAQGQQAFAHGASDFWREPVDASQLDLGLQALITKEWFATRAASPARTVLVADDDLFFLRRISDLLEASGYRTLQARSGTEALQLLESSTERPALCVMDLFMPGLGGIELAHRLRDNPKWANVPVIAVSGVRRDRQVIDELARLGVRDFVDKAVVAIDSVAAIADEYLSDPASRRRAPPRVSTLALADFRREASEPWLTGLVCNISASGAFLRTAIPPQPGSLVHLRVELGASAPRLMTRARVAWIRTRRTGSPEPHGMGVEFTEISEEASRALEDWVEQGSALPTPLAPDGKRALT